MECETAYAIFLWVPENSIYLSDNLTYAVSLITAKARFIPSGIGYYTSIREKGKKRLFIVTRMKYSL